MLGFFILPHVVVLLISPPPAFSQTSLTSVKYTVKQIDIVTIHYHNMIMNEAALQTKGVKLRKTGLRFLGKH